MLKAMINFVRGSISILLYLVNLVFFSCVTLLTALFIWIIPLRAWRRHSSKVLHFIPTIWTTINYWIMLLSTRGKWDIAGTCELNPQGSYLLIANHSSWLDIIVLSSVFSRRIPLLKFFMKKELLWMLPIAGIACYVLGYPFMERHTREDIRKNPALKGKDIETTHNACLKFKERPTTIMNFVEGTRFSEAKRLRSHSPYQHLLKPKSGGIAVVLNEMQDTLDGLLDVTIHYRATKLSFWEFACGNIERISVHYRCLPITEELLGNYYEDREFRKRIQQWLNSVWEAKDEHLKQLETTS